MHTVAVSGHSGKSSPNRHLHPDNNFDLIRLFAALQVVAMHSTVHLRTPLWAEVDSVLRMFHGVPIFFFISGLLVTASFHRRPLLKYAEARIRRVFPGLWAAFLMAFVLLLAAHQITTSSLTTFEFWAWVAAQLTVLQFYSPAIFSDFGVGVVNGSLWTIPVELGFYAMLPMIAWVARRSHHPDRAWQLLAVAGALLSFLTYLATTDRETIWAKLLFVTPMPHFWYFAAGILAYLNLPFVLKLLSPLQRISFGFLIPLGVYVLMVVVLRPVLPPPLLHAATFPLLCLAILSIGLIAPSRARILGGWDLSYSAYLYHMLVINAFIAAGFFGWPAVALTFAITLALAAASWNLIEEPALRRGRRAALKGAW